MPENREHFLSKLSSHTAELHPRFQATKQHKHLKIFYLYFYRERKTQTRIYPTFLFKCQSNQPVKMSSFILINRAQGCGLSRHARVQHRRGAMNPHNAPQETGQMVTYTNWDLPVVISIAQIYKCYTIISMLYKVVFKVGLTLPKRTVKFSGFIPTILDWRVFF